MHPTAVTATSLQGQLNERHDAASDVVKRLDLSPSDERLVALLKDPVVLDTASLGVITQRQGSRHKMIDVSWLQEEALTGLSVSSVHLWDVRAGWGESCMLAAKDMLQGAEFACMAASPDGNLVAGASLAAKLDHQDTTHIVVWDIRAKRVLHHFTEFHSDDATQLTFRDRSTLFSSAADGLIACIDLNQPEDENPLETLNVDDAIQSFVLFGKERWNVAAFTVTDRVSIWKIHPSQDGEDEEITGNEEVTMVDDVCECGSIKQFPPRESCDYAVGGIYESDTDTLWALGGSDSGRLLLFNLMQGGEINDTIMTYKEYTEGHSTTVSCITPFKKGKKFVTGGDDGRLCMWDLKGGDSLSQALKRKRVRNGKVSVASAGELGVPDAKKARQNTLC